MYLFLPLECTAWNIYHVGNHGNQNDSEVGVMNIVLENCSVTEKKYVRKVRVTESKVEVFIKIAKASDDCNFSLHAHTCM